MLFSNVALIKTFLLILPAMVPHRITMCPSMGPPLPQFGNHCFKISSKVSTFEILIYKYVYLYIIYIYIDILTLLTNKKINK